MEATKNWKVELTTGGKSLAEVKIQRGIFQKDAFWPLLFIIAMMQLNDILRKCTGGYNFTKSPGKDLSPYAQCQSVCKKNEAGLETQIQRINIYRQNIGIEFGVEILPRSLIKSGKRQRAEEINLPDQERIRTLGEKENTSNCMYWKRTLSNKRIWKKILEKNTADGQKKLLEINWPC